jgi:type II secretory pathway component PulL
MEEINKCCKLDKKTIWTVVLGLYILASAVFIVYVLYQNFKIQYSENAYNNGQEATIQQIITQAKDESCAPFYVYTASEKVQLISTTCLTTAENTNTNQ